MKTNFEKSINQSNIFHKLIILIEITYIVKKSNESSHLIMMCLTIDYLENYHQQLSSPGEYLAYILKINMMPFILVDLIRTYYVHLLTTMLIKNKCCLCKDNLQVNKRNPERNECKKPFLSSTDNNH